MTIPRWGGERRRRGTRTTRRGTRTARRPRTGGGGGGEEAAASGGAVRAQARARGVVLVQDGGAWREGGRSFFLSESAVLPILGRGRGRGTG